MSRQRWLARASVLLLCAALALVLGFGAQRGLWLLAVALLGLVAMVAAAYIALAHRGGARLVALVLLVVVPVAVLGLFVTNGLFWAVVGVLVATALAVAVGRAALAPLADSPGMPEYDVARPRHPFIVMNPHSGGGKVGRFRLKEKAEALGAEVFVLGDCDVDVAAVARDAVSRGADLLGVAGGDGTQALVAGVAADLGVPFMVISAGTRNHFALDLGLDREDPSTCLAALGDDAVEQRVDLGSVAGRTFVNNASFGAYAAVVQSPAYRNDKTRTTWRCCPTCSPATPAPVSRSGSTGSPSTTPKRSSSATTRTAWGTWQGWGAGPGSTPACSASWP